jgi:hypothetical protein
LRAELDFQDITKVGLPIIDERNTSVAFLWDGNIVNGWPISETEPGKAIPLNDLSLIAWEGSDFKPPLMGLVAGVRYWSYIPDVIRELWQPDFETTWMYRDGRK